MAYIMEKAGGRAITGEVDVLNITPKSIHERCGIICGSADDVTDCEKFYLAHKK